MYVGSCKFYCIYNRTVTNSNVTEICNVKVRLFCVLLEHAYLILLK